MSDAVVERDREEPPAWDEASRREHGSCTSQDRVIATHEMNGRGQWSACNEAAHPRHRASFSQCEQAEAVRVTRLARKPAIARQIPQSESYRR